MEWVNGMEINTGAVCLICPVSQSGMIYWCYVAGMAWDMTRLLNEPARWNDSGGEGSESVMKGVIFRRVE